MSLVTLLEREAEAIRSGDFAALSSLANEKARALEEFRASDERQDTLDRIKHLSERNDRLLAAARAGLEAASARIAAISRGAELDTYTTDGARRTIGSPKGTVQRRV